MILDQAIQALAQQWNVDPKKLGPAADKRYRLEFEAGFVFELLPLDQGQILLEGSCCEREIELPLIQQLLHMACARFQLDCATLTWDRVSGRYLLQQKADLSALVWADWLKTAEDFLSSLDFWYKIGHQEEVPSSGVVSPFVVMP